MSRVVVEQEIREVEAFMLCCSDPVTKAEFEEQLCRLYTMLTTAR